MILDVHSIGCPMGCGGGVLFLVDGYRLSRDWGAGVSCWGLAPLTPCMVACCLCGVGVRLSPLCVLWVTVVVYVEVHLGDTGWSNDFVGCFFSVWVLCDFSHCFSFVCGGVLRFLVLLV